MTVIKKLIDGNGNQYFPQTHTKAVIDDQGNSVESRMQAVQDVVNQAQMAIGAVPNDLTPTEDSTNWVTSGGVFNALSIGSENEDIDLSEYTQVQAFPNSSNKWVVNSSSTPYFGIFIPIIPNKKYKIVANEDAGTYYCFLINNNYSNGATVQYATGCSRVAVAANGQSIGSAPNNANYLYVCTTTTDDNTPQKVEKCNKELLKDIITPLLSDFVLLDYITEIEESGFAICGENLNIIVKVDETGIHAPNILDYEQL